MVCGLWHLRPITEPNKTPKKERGMPTPPLPPAPDEISQLYKDTLRSIVLIIALHYGSLREMHRSDQTWLEA